VSLSVERHSKSPSQLWVFTQSFLTNQQTGWGMGAFWVKTLQRLIIDANLNFQENSNQIKNSRKTILIYFIFLSIYL
jgi:hypothetical protein